MANVLIACAVCPAGDAFWERWLDSPPQERGARLGPVVRLTAAEVMPAGGASPVPDRRTTARLLQARLPSGRIDLLQIVVAVAADNPEGTSSLEALLTAVSGIFQVPLRTSVLLLSPDFALRSDNGTDALRALLTGALSGRSVLGDVCWVRSEAGSPPSGSETIPHTCVRAAIHPVWAEDTEARRPLAIQQGLGTLHRDSVSCRLQFDRDAWLHYAAADVGRRLAGAIIDPPPLKGRGTAANWVPELLRRVRAAAVATAVPRATPPPRPSSVFEPSPKGTLSTVARSLGEQARLSSADALMEKEGKALGNAATETARYLNEAEELDSDKLQALASAFHRCEAMLEEISRPHREPDPANLALRKTWMVTINQVHETLAGTLSVPAFDPASPETWSQRLAEWQMLQAAMEAMPGTRQEAACVAKWATRLVPAVLGDAPADEIWEAIVEPLAEALAGQESAIARVLTERKAEHARIAADHPAPSGAWARFFVGHKRDQNLQRAQEACDKRHKARLDAIYGVVDALFESASPLFELAARQESLARVDALLLKTVTTMAAPARQLFHDFAERQQRFREELDRFPEEPDRSPDTLGLLAKAEVAALAGDIDPQADKWLDDARAQTPKQNRTWLTVAGSCLGTLDAWADGRARNFSVDLPGLLDARFPQLAGPRLAELSTMARTLLLPVRHRNASHRRLHQEWHVSTHPRFATNPAFDANIVHDDVTSMASTSTVQLPLDDRDRLEIHLHLLGFDPRDIQWWNLFPDEGSPNPVQPQVQGDDGCVPLAEDGQNREGQVS